MNFSRPHYLKPYGYFGWKGLLTTTPTSSCSRLSNNVSSNNVPCCSPPSLPYTSPHALFHLLQKKKVPCLSKPLARTTQEYLARCLLPVKSLCSNNNSIIEATPSLSFLAHTSSSHSPLCSLLLLPCLHSRTTLSAGYITICLRLVACRHLHLRILILRSVARSLSLLSL